MGDQYETTTTVVNYDESVFDLSDEEKEVFVSAENSVKLVGTITGHVESHHSDLVCFHNQQARIASIQMYLAYHSKHIRDEIICAPNQKLLKNVVITLKFKNGDREILSRVFDPSVIHYQIVKKDDIVTHFPFLQDIDLSEKTTNNNMIDLFVAVYVPNQEQIFHFHRFQVDLLQLYCGVERPQVLYDGRLVMLTMLERSIFLAPETKTTFYNHNGKFEPVLMERQLRDSLVESIIRSSCKHFGESLNGHILHINFRNGDRDIIKAVNGALMVDSETVALESLESLSNHPCIDKLRALDSVLVDYFLPGSSEISTSNIYPLKKE